MIKLILIRGLPGCGKSSLAEELILTSGYHSESDQFFMIDDKYQFDSIKLPEAHQWCLDQVISQVKSLKEIGAYNECVVVSNTFTQRWEMESYIQLAQKEDLQLIVADLFDGGCDNETLFNRNKHGVPIERLNIMREQYEHDWRNGNIIPPWER